MAKFCGECGKPLRENAKFCAECGAKVHTALPDTTPQVKPAPVQTAQTAPVRAAQPRTSSAPVRTAAPYTANSRTAAPAPVQTPEPDAFPAANPVSQPTNTAVSAPVSAAAERSVQSAGAAVNQYAGGIAKSVLGAAVPAAQNAGETVLGEMLPAASEAAAAIPAGNVFGTLFSGIGSFAGGIFGSIIKPWKLLPAALMAGIWMILAQLQNSGETWVKIASWITFAKGGLTRETLAGTVGGLLGKGVTAVALGSLFTGGLPNACRGIAALFKKGAKKSIVGALFGIVIGAALYVAFAGWDSAGKDTAMAGISGALLCLEGIGSENGWLYRLAGALTAKAKDGVRQMQSGKATSLTAGIAAGFAAAAAYFALR